MRDFEKVGESIGKWFCKRLARMPAPMHFKFWIFDASASFPNEKILSPILFKRRLQFGIFLKLTIPNRHIGKLSKTQSPKSHAHPNTVHTN